MHLVILTGAGISAASGLPTFRDKDALWDRYDWQRLATPEAFASEPEEVHAFYNARRRMAREAEPNEAHLALAALERDLGAQGHRLTLITQNVDPLHARAGSRDLLAMHGQLDRVRCTACGAVATGWVDDLSTATPCPACTMTGSLRPDICWFGEVPFHLDEIGSAMETADHFAAIGTSGLVYPAAGLVEIAKARGIPRTEINLGPSEASAHFTHHHHGPATQTVPAFAATIRAAPGPS